jgi:hypothetical protein
MEAERHLLEEGFRRSRVRTRAHRGKPRPKATVQKLS